MNVDEVVKKIYERYQKISSQSNYFSDNKELIDFVKSYFNDVINGLNIEDVLNNIDYNKDDQTQVAVEVLLPMVNDEKFLYKYIVDTKIPSREYEYFATGKSDELIKKLIDKSIDNHDSKTALQLMKSVSDENTRFEYYKKNVNSIYLDAEISHQFITSFKNPDIILKILEDNQLLMTINQKFHENKDVVFERLSNKLNDQQLLELYELQNDGIIKRILIKNIHSDEKKYGLLKPHDYVIDYDIISSLKMPKYKKMALSQLDYLLDGNYSEHNITELSKGLNDQDLDDLVKQSNSKQLNNFLAQQFSGDKYRYEYFLRISNEDRDKIIKSFNSSEYILKIFDNKDYINNSKGSELANSCKFLNDSEKLRVIDKIKGKYDLIANIAIIINDNSKKSNILLNKDLLININEDTYKNISHNLLDIYMQSTDENKIALYESIAGSNSLVKRDLLATISNDEYKLKKIATINNIDDKLLVAKTIRDTNILKSTLPYLYDSEDFVSIIETRLINGLVTDEELVEYIKNAKNRASSLKLIKYIIDDSKKIVAVKSYDDENIYKAVNYINDSWKRQEILKDFFIQKKFNTHTAYDALKDPSDRLFALSYDGAFSSYNNYIMEYIHQNSRDKSSTVFDIIKTSPNMSDVILNLYKIHLFDSSISYDDETSNKFKLIFAKTRSALMPDWDTLKAMTLEDANKLTFNQWQTINKYIVPLCGNNKVALVNMIRNLGLFEKEDSSTRTNKINQIIENQKYYFDDIDYNFRLMHDNINPDFFVPYKRVIYKLKDNELIPSGFDKLLKYKLTAKERNFLLHYNKHTESSYGAQLAKLVKEMYEKTEENGYISRDDLTNEEKQKLIKDMFNVTTFGNLNWNSIGYLFGSNGGKYNPNAYNFFLEHYDEIMSREENMKLYPLISENWKQLEGIYGKYFDVLQCKDYFTNHKFNASYGNDDLETLAISSGVQSNESFEFYQKIRSKMECRKYSNLIRSPHRIYEIDGHKYETELLRSDDPYGMLVGEKNNTDCCQIYNNVGRNCMIHANTSQSGGIFVIKLVDNPNDPVLLTQSWDWVNEGVYCHDNIEGSKLLKSSRDLKEGVIEVLRRDAKEKIKRSKEEISTYIEQRKEAINESMLSQEEKEKEIKKTDDLNRQVIKVVTVGDRNNDVGVSQNFYQLMNDIRLPKDYNVESFKSFGISQEDLKSFYSDADKQQHIIEGNEKELIPEDYGYVEKPIFIDQRKVESKSGEDIVQNTIKIIASIAKKVNPEENRYRDYERTILGYNDLAETYDANPKTLKVKYGEDWYMVYDNDDDNFNIYDIERTTPRVFDEKTNQSNEIINSLIGILSFSKEQNKSIKADIQDDGIYNFLTNLNNKQMIDTIQDREEKNMHKIIFKPGVNFGVKETKIEDSKKTKGI
jgi:hypothetical protein